jgi:cobalt/nickel transport system permease protein
LRHARIERWSRQQSAIHRRHAVARILAALVMLVCIATVQGFPTTLFLVDAVLLAGLTWWARLPLRQVLAAASVVLPFALILAAVTLLAGQPERAAALLARSYLSSLTALLLVATTPLPDLLAGLETLRAPRFLLQVMQFLYRYLIVLVEEASAMRDASRSRAGNFRILEWRRAASAAGVLFARSYNRAIAIHRAMMARGFEGHLPRLHSAAFRTVDACFLGVCVLISIGTRWLLV